MRDVSGGVTRVNLTDSVAYKLLIRTKIYKTTLILFFVKLFFFIINVYKIKLRHAWSHTIRILLEQDP